MFARINQKTGSIFTPDEVYAALNEAGELVYQKVLKENRGVKSMFRSGNRLFLFLVRLWPRGEL